MRHPLREMGAEADESWPGTHEALGRDRRRRLGISVVMAVSVMAGTFPDTPTTRPSSEPHLLEGYVHPGRFRGLDLQVIWEGVFIVVILPCKGRTPTTGGPLSGAHVTIGLRN